MLCSDLISQKGHTVQFFESSTFIRLARFANSKLQIYRLQGSLIMTATNSEIESTTAMADAGQTAVAMFANCPLSGQPDLQCLQTALFPASLTCNVCKLASFQPAGPQCLQTAAPSTASPVSTASLPAMFARCLCPASRATMFATLSLSLYRIPARKSLQAALCLAPWPCTNFQTASGEIEFLNNFKSQPKILRGHNSQCS